MHKEGLQGRLYLFNQNVDSGAEHKGSVIQYVADACFCCALACIPHFLKLPTDIFNLSLYCASAWPTMHYVEGIVWTLGMVLMVFFNTTHCETQTRLRLKELSFHKGILILSLCHGPDLDQRGTVAIYLKRNAYIDANGSLHPRETMA